MFRRLFHPDPIAESTPKETPAKETPAPAAPPRPRRTAVTHEVSHRPVAGSDRATKEAIADKMGDKLSKAMEESSEKVKIKSHFRGKTKKEVPPPPDETPTPKGSADPAASTPEPVKKEQESSTEKKDDGAAVTESSASVPALPATSDLGLPDAHRRSLANFGWTDEEIEQGIKSGGAPFLATAAKIHKQRANEIEAYARAGQAGLKAPEPKAAPAPLPNQGSMESRVLQQLANTKKAYPGNDALFDQVFAPQVWQAQNDDKRATQQREEMLAHQVKNFFGAPALKNYEGFYGGDKLTAEHQTNRDKVINTAAFIIHGAAAQGRPLTVEEALQMAHDATSAPVAKAAARTEVINEIKDRAAGLTQRNQAGPSSPQAEGKKGPLSREDIEKRAGQRMKSAGLIGR